VTRGRGAVVVGAGLVLALVALVTVVRLVGLDRGPVTVALVAGYPWLVLLASLAALVGVGLREPRITVTGAVLAAIGAAVIVPRALPGPQPAVTVDGPTLVVAVANLKVGAADPDAVVAAVERAGVDVLVTVELTDTAVVRLAAAGLGDVLPTVVRRGGGALHARVGLESAPAGPGDVDRSPAGVLAVPGAAPVLLTSLHPVPPVGGSRTATWRSSLAAIADAPLAGDLGIVAGDLNATLDHRALRDVLDRGWVDAADAVGQGLRPTYSGVPHGTPAPPMVIDHVLVDPRVAVERVDVVDLPGSDHRMVIAHLRLPAAGATP
jgi:endonuclease/exonuclease/phosphatase (EEP) superfamily protein YafD